MHGIYQFDEAVQAISALKTPLRTGFLPVCLVHARTKLADVYDVRPVNAEEEGLPAGPYFYTTFPPLNQGLQRVAVASEMPVLDAPDMSQLVTVDVESISGSARRGSRDSATESDSENRIPVEFESCVTRQVDVSAICSSVSRDSEDGSDLSEQQIQVENKQGDGRSAYVHCGQAESEFVSIESVIAHPKLAEDSLAPDDIGIGSSQGEAKSDCSSEQYDSNDLVEISDLSPSGEPELESHPAEVMAFVATQDESSGDASVSSEAANVEGSSKTVHDRFVLADTVR